MIPCPSCACHVASRDIHCPHCGQRIGLARRPSLAAAVLALGLSGCVGGTKSETGETADSGDTTTTAEPLYGVTVTETGDTGTTTGVDYGSPP